MSLKCLLLFSLIRPYSHRFVQRTREGVGLLNGSPWQNLETLKEGVAQWGMEKKYSAVTQKYLYFPVLICLKKVSLYNMALTCGFKLTGALLI